MRAQPRWSRTSYVTIAALAMVLGAAPGRTSADDAPEMTGFWKLVELRFIEAERLTFEVKDVNGKLVASIAEPAQLRDNNVETFAHKGETVTIGLSINGNRLGFTGKATKGNTFVGTFAVGSQLMPARLVKTDDKILAQPQPPNELFQALNAVEQAKDPKAKVDKLAGILHGQAGAAKYSMLYAELLRYATIAHEPPEQVEKFLDEWIDGAAPYGHAWSLSVRVQAVKILAGDQPYAELALRLAERTEKELSNDDPLEQRAEVASAVASAAKLAGKADVLASAEARAKKLDAELDADYREKVPPFKPAAFAGRKVEGADRVVLLELFTGAQCPPCVAADVAFDALNTTYKPSELIALQYHLHIPGPDPLTSPASLARHEYYDVGSTPTAFFNGRAQKGGGFMAGAKAKYDEYRDIVENFLEQKKRASIDLHVERTDDEIKITASAQTKAKPETKDGDEKDAGSGDTSPPKLRLVLAEEEIRYVGGNKIRYHHHVVRDLPGGAEGKALVGGAAKAEVTVKLSELRRTLETSLDTFVQEHGRFPNPRPPIELKHLIVVALVQDDSSKTVLHAVAAPAGAGDPAADK